MAEFSLDDLNAMDAAAFVTALSNIYEYSPWIAEIAAAKRPFATIGDLYAAMKSAVEQGSVEKKMALIEAHPDLADKTQRAAGLTEDSSSEQTSVGLDQLSDAEYKAFTDVNTAYRAKFGFPYIVSVRRHTKDSILRDFARRLPNDIAAETAHSLSEISRIAAVRLDQLVSGPGPLSVHGRLSTHVLDTHSGKPAARIPLELVEVCAQGENRLIARAFTNSDGRTDVPLIGGRPAPIGEYELTFSVGAYFASRDVPQSDPPFLDRITIRFSISDPEGHLHVPLLVTPWSYGTYRGS